METDARGVPTGVEAARAEKRSIRRHLATRLRELAEQVEQTEDPKALRKSVDWAAFVADWLNGLSAHDVAHQKLLQALHAGGEYAHEYSERWAPEVNRAVVLTDPGHEGLNE